MPLGFARLRRSVFGTRIVLWAVGMVGWIGALSHVPVFVERPLMIPLGCLIVAFLHTMPTMRSHMAGPWTFLDSLALGGVGAAVPMVGDAAFGPLDTDLFGFLVLLAAFALPTVLGAVWPHPRVSPERLRRDVEDAVHRALVQGRLAEEGHAIVRVALDPAVCHGGHEAIEVHGATGLRRIPAADRFVRPTPFPLMLVMGKDRVLFRTDGLPLDVLAPYGLPVALPTHTWQAFPGLVVWEAPTTAHGRLALAAKLAGQRTPHATPATATT